MKKKNNDKIKVVMTIYGFIFIFACVLGELHKISKNLTILMIATENM
jgi:hypothetical protein